MLNYWPMKVKATYCHHFTLPVAWPMPDRLKIVDADVGIIRLEDDIPIGIPGHQPAKFPIVNLAPPTYVLENWTDLWITGWGLTNETHPTRTELLQKNRIQTKDDVYCYNYLRPFGEEGFCNLFFYGGNRVNTSLYSDSGGPAFDRLPREDISMQVGIMSATDAE